MGSFVSSSSFSSAAAVNLLLGTCAQESAFGRFLEQINGPALGIYQMEPATYHDIYNNYIKYQPDIIIKLDDLGYKTHAPDRLIYDLRYATIMTRLHYARISDPLPDFDDIPGLAAYWKEHYNTRLGKGTEKEFIKNYSRYVK